jgi:Glycosyl transferase family 2
VKVVLTLIVRDEADIVDAQLSYHLNAGIDFVIAVDHESRDGTTEILESYARQGLLRRIPEAGPVLELEWRTHMARLAATEHGADWVVAADADEFWIPRDGTLREVLGAAPERYGTAGGVICHFVPRPDDGAPFAERMTARLRPQAPVNDPTSPWRPSPKLAFRAAADVFVLHAGYAVLSPSIVPLPGWCPFDVFHFPCRSVAQWANKTARRGHVEADKPLGQYVKGLRAQHGGLIEDVYGSLVVDDEQLARGLADGTLLVDTRLRDALRGQRPAASPGPPVDASGLHEATVVRLQRRVDDARVRINRLERKARLRR